MPVASGQGKWPVTYGVTRDTIEAKKDARCAICVQKSCFIVSQIIKHNFIFFKNKIQSLSVNTILQLEMRYSTMAKRQLHVMTIVSNRVRMQIIIVIM